jgi:dTDP-4-dehydrorhamnose reductase
MEKILITGASGQLGKTFQRLAPEYPYDFSFLNREVLDLSRPELLEDVLEDFEFKVLIHCAAYTAVDKAESEKVQAQIINAEATEKLAQICRKKEAVLIHFSTDYVFEAKIPIPLKEDDPVSPLNAYGETKLAGEKAIRAVLNEHLILRTSWLYGKEGKNFPETMIRLATQRNELRVVFDQVGTPTFCDDLARGTLSILPKMKGNFGTYHFSNEGVCSWYDFAHAVLKGMEKDVKLIPVKSEEFPTPARRPSYSVLDKSKIRNTFGIEIRHWQDALEDYLNQRKT